jgi:serine/threonine-protein kinase
MGRSGRAEGMNGRMDLPLDPLLSRAETLAGDGSAFDHSPPGGRGSKVPAFPVKDWDRYECLGFLGQGGMGMVFLGRDRKLGREVAIKFVRVDDERHLARFLVEARAQARVDHEHVCKVFEVGEVEGKVFITMQRIAGTSLDVVGAELSQEEKVLVLRDAARGVHAAHRVGIIHRDLKPSNIMVERAEDGSLRTFVMDFGLAREWNQDVTETGSVLGTPVYMSPEQARGEVSRLDRRTDVYSLGAALYHQSTGHPPVSGSNPLEILSAIGSAEVPSMRAHRMDIPRDLEAITLKCLEKERSKRYDSAKALADDLDRFLAGEPVLARPTGLLYRIQRRIRKHKHMALVSAAALLVVLLALAGTLRTRREASRRETLAQQFTESMARIESLTRYSALSPLHDIRPDLQAVQAHMAQLREQMQQAGSLANGPGHYALGRGYMTLDDDEKAGEHLQMAWDAGYREPRVAYALAVVLGRRYQEKLLEAERTSAKDQREARIKEIESRLRAPALSFLRQARGSDAPSPGYLEALMAFYEGRLEEALGRLKSLERDLPWFYEGPLLRGTLLQAQAWKRWNKGQWEEALADFEAGRKDLAAAAASGRSAPAVYAAMAELELNALIMEKYGQGQVKPAFSRGMTAVETALRAQPDHVPSLILRASLLGNLADFNSNRGEPAEDLVHQAVASAQAAVKAGPLRADAWTALGMAYYQWGSVRLDQNLDPSDQLAHGLEALESLSQEKRDYTVENHIGLIHQTWADFDGQRGRDPSSHLNGAIAAYERATGMAPHLLPAWINLGTCLHQRASLPMAVHPLGDLEAALKVLDQAQSLNPKHFVPYFVRGKVLLGLALQKRAQGGEPEPELLKSIEASRQGIAINPGVPHLHNGLGVAQVELAHTAWASGRDPSPLLAKAREAYQRAAAVASKEVNASINLGDLQIWKARYEGSSASLAGLGEVEGLLRRALMATPGHKVPLATLGRLEAVKIELALREGREPVSPNKGEAALAKALALDPHDRDSHQYLGELRTAWARWKALHRRAEARDFDLAAEAFQGALNSTPHSQETLLALASLHLARAQWERERGQDPTPSLSRGRAALDPLLKARPHWAETIALKAGLGLVEVGALPPAERGPRAGEALRTFQEAFRLNRNLVGAWKPLADQAQRWEAASR